MVRHHPLCVQRLWHSYGDVSQIDVYIRTVGVPNFRFSQSSPLGVVHCHSLYLTCTPTVQVFTVLPSLRTKTVAPVQQRKQKAVYIRTASVSNSVCTRVLWFVWFTAMHVLGILHLLYETPRDLTICVHRLCGHLYGNVSQQAVQIPTAVVPKYRLRHSSPIGVVYCHAHYCNRTPTVRGTTGSPNLCTKAVWAPYDNKVEQPVQLPKVVVPKCSFRQSSSLGVCTTMCISELYTYCTRCYSTP